MEDKIKATTSNVQELDNATESVASNELINKEADMTQQDINKDGNTSVTTEEVNEGNKEKEQSLSTTVTATIGKRLRVYTLHNSKKSSNS